MIRMAEESKDLTAVITPFGKYSFNYMPFVSRMLLLHFRGQWIGVLAPLDYAYPYLDDIIVFSPSWEEHLEALQQVV